MTVLECVGCTMIAYGIPFSMFIFTIAFHPFRIIISMTRYCHLSFLGCDDCREYLVHFFGLSQCFFRR